MGIRDAPNEDVAFRQISLALVGNAHLSCAYLEMIYWPSSDPVVGVYISVVAAEVDHCPPDESVTTLLVVDTTRSTLLITRSVIEVH